MSSFNNLLNPAPYHIISYGTLLGTTLYQSFLVGPLSYSALSRPQFSTLQTKLFPPYFITQTALSVLMALTFPASPSPSTADRLSPLAGAAGSSSIPGLLENRNYMTGLLPIASMFVIGAVNLVWLGPQTTKVMKERKHQETRDGKKYDEKGAQSKEMLGLNKRFGRLHGSSALINLVGAGVMVWYGLLLGERVQ